MDPQSITMDSTFKSGRNRPDRGLGGFEAGGCDITSLVFQRRGQYGFDLTVHRRFVPPTSSKIDTIPLLELPGPLMSSSPTIGLDEDLIFGEPGGVRTSFLSGVHEATLEHDDPMPTPSQANRLNADLEPVPNVKIHANNFGFNINFSTQVEKSLVQMVPEQQTENYQTVVHGPVLGYFDEKGPNDIFTVNDPGPTMDFSGRFEANPDFPTFDQGAVFSSNDFDYLCDVETTLNVPSESLEIGFSSNEFNFSDSAPIASQEGSFSSAPSSASSYSFSSSSSSSSELTKAAPQRISATTPTIVDPTLDSHLCQVCHLTFKRPSDLKRHEGMHFPEQRIFHCKQLGCERKGRKGFYRRDKLRTHQRHVHGLDN
jgi:hypothetical protein